jgi:hypothetical protein
VIETMQRGERRAKEKLWMETAQVHFHFSAPAVCNHRKRARADMRMEGINRRSPRSFSP